VGYGPSSATIRLLAPGAGTVLVVDDEQSLRLLCRVNLELAGFDVLEAGTIPEARRLLESSHVDVAILDVHVAGEDGRDLLDELRAADSAVRVVFLTGSADIRGKRLAGGDAIVPKPFEPDVLVDVVRQLAALAAVDSPR
jgi:DNA-binding response OmpR family regulator